MAHIIGSVCAVYIYGSALNHSVAWDFMWWAGDIFNVDVDEKLVTVAKRH